MISWTHHFNIIYERNTSTAPLEVQYRKHKKAFSVVKKKKNL